MRLKRPILHLSNYNRLRINPMKEIRSVSISLFKIYAGSFDVKFEGLGSTVWWAHKGLGCTPIRGFNSSVIKF